MNRNFNYNQNLFIRDYTMIIESIYIMYVKKVNWIEKYIMWFKYSRLDIIFKARFNFIFK